MNTGNDDSPIDGGALCRWIARRIEARPLPDHPGTWIYAHGGIVDDAIHVGAEHTTTVLAASADDQRWFRIEVVEFDPDTQPVWEQDPLTILTLKQRAAAHHPKHQ